ncbi:unnamed protein product [Rotaria sp. Silwood2]|nr:unnamed protein product [Rotaria sp. Silwood2]
MPSSSSDIMKQTFVTNGLQYILLPSDVHRHCLLVTNQVITVDSRVHTGLEVLVKEYQCKQSNMILITSFSTPDGIKHICELYPGITIFISEIDTVALNHVGKKYFRTD